MAAMIQPAESSSSCVNYMDIAMDAAKQAALQGEVPVGAVIVRAGEVLVVSANLVETQGDALAHAEMVAIRAAAQKLGRKWLDDCDLYVTLEPCVMCAGAIAHARLRRLYFGAWDVKMGAVESGVRVFHQPTCHHKPEVYSGIQARESEALLKAFFASRR